MNLTIKNNKFVKIVFDWSVLVFIVFGFLPLMYSLILLMLDLSDVINFTSNWVFVSIISISLICAVIIIIFIALLIIFNKKLDKQEEALNNEQIIY